MTNARKLKRLERRARRAIRRSYGKARGEYGATLFVEHHLEELDDACWMKHLGRAQPTPRSNLGMLVLRPPEDDDEDDLEILDFTLPDDATNYVLSVEFNPWGWVSEISMES